MRFTICVTKRFSLFIFIFIFGFWFPKNTSIDSEGSFGKKRWFCYPTMYTMFFFRWAWELFYNYLHVNRCEYRPQYLTVWNLRNGSVSCISRYGSSCSSIGAKFRMCSPVTSYTLIIAQHRCDIMYVLLVAMGFILLLMKAGLSGMIILQELWSVFNNVLYVSLKSMLSLGNDQR